MSLAAGTRLGPYEVLSPLGAGGMGEVYRARDPRLGRDVAIKVVAGDEAPSAEHQRRFEQEARAVAALRHPHILAVHDVGSHEGRPYVVFELLEGETLRERLARGPLPVGKAIEVGVQIAKGLAAAHAHGVVHRDLKPENLFLARESGTKLLDFGLAKLRESSDDGSEVPTASATEAGRWVGTPGYISPEQLKGERADERSDVFALGAVLYEMLTGQRAFKGSSRADTLSAILERDPPSMTLPGGPVPPPLERVVRRCLEKDPEDRFQSARDVAFAIDAVSGSSSGATAPGATRPAPVRRLRRASVALLAGAALVALGMAAGRKVFEKPPPTFKQLTFRRGFMDFARFAPDGRTVIYGAGWEGRPLELFQTRTDSPESRPLGLAPARVLSISSRGEMAITRGPVDGGVYFGRGTLAVVPVGGASPPRELLTDVVAADWMPDGRQLAVSRGSGQNATIELPPGNVIYRPRGGVSFFRLSPDGRRVAFLDSGTGSLVALDLARSSITTLVERVDANFFGLAWAPSSHEVWFTQGPRPGTRDLFAVDLEGRRRLVYRSAGVLALLDISPDGRVLLHRSMDTNSVTALLSGDALEREVSVSQGSLVSALSDDGRTLLIDDESEAAGSESAVYLRRPGCEPVRVAQGRGMDLSTDGQSLLVLEGDRLKWVPTGPGLPRDIDAGPALPEGARFGSAAGHHVVVWGRERPGEPRAIWLAGLEGEKPHRLDLVLPPPLDTYGSLAVSPDGRFLAGVKAPGVLTLLPLDGGDVRDVGRVSDNLRVSRWSGDGRAVFLTTASNRWPCQIQRLELATGSVALLRELKPADTTGIVNTCLFTTPSADGTAYAYGSRRCVTDLVLAEGLR
jgi:hypothetical protein